MNQRLVLSLAAALLACARPSPAHDVPSDVVIRLFARAEPGTFRVLVRVPLASMNDVPWPARGLLLDLADPDMPAALRTGAKDWILDRIDVYEEDVRLDGRLAAVRVSLPSDDSFRAYDEALRSLRGPSLPPDAAVVRSQAFVDALLEYPIRSDRSRFSIDPRYRLLGLRALTVLRFIAADGTERALEFHDDPGLVRLDPRWLQAALLFVGEGFRHILTGADHLLFLLGLVIPVRRFRQLAVVVTAFMLAHSITLAASAYGLAPGAAWFPPLVETLIAASILYMALENIVAPGPAARGSGRALHRERRGVGTAGRDDPRNRDGHDGLLGRRWAVAFGFGLVHGFGFSFALRDSLQLAGSHMLTALVSFNAGVEVGQLLVLAALIPALELAFRRIVAERVGTIILSAFVAHTGWHWTVDRAQQLRRYPFELPDLTPAFFLVLVRWAMIAVGAAAVWWLCRVVRVAWRAARVSGSPSGAAHGLGGAPARFKDSVP